MSSYRDEIVDTLTTEWLREQPLLNIILDNCFDQVFIKDLSSTLIYANRNLARHYGLKEVDQILGKSDFDFYSYEHAEATRQEESDIMQSGEPLLAKLYSETWPRGDETWNLCSKLPLRNSGGEIIGLIGFGRDITKDKLCLRTASMTPKNRATPRFKLSKVEWFDDVIICPKL